MAGAQASGQLMHTGDSGKMMEKWIVYAFASLVFAGFTSVIAKRRLTRL
jgi:hypothetical protein